MSNFVPGFPTPNTPIPQFKQMLDNWNSLNTNFEKDHTFFTEPDANKIGHHKQVFLNGPLAAPVPLPTGTQAAAFPKSSVAPIAGVTQLLYQNVSSALYLLSCVKAWATCNPAGVVQDGFNCSGTMGAAGNYTITFTNPLPNANYAVIVSSLMTPDFINGSIVGSSNYAAGSFKVNSRTLTANSATGVPISFSFVVLQT